MEVKNWSYAEFPAFDEPVEGAVRIPTTGDEPGVVYRHDVEYCEIGGTKLHLQILQPSSRNTGRFLFDPAAENAPDRPAYPCILFVQGSGWFPQYVYGNIPQLSKLASRGYIVAVVEYRHNGIAPFPAPVVDARNAVRFLRKNAKQFLIDPEKMILSGDSSGGHTAVYAGILHNDGDPEQDLFPGFSGEVRGIINLYGCTDFTFPDSNPTTANHNRADSPEGLEMGGIDLNENRTALDTLSIPCRINPETEIVPVMNLHGTKDRTVNCRCSVNLHKRLRECGKDSELYLVEGADHGGSEFWTDCMLDRMEDFIRRCLA